jgi:hypothetical protein
MFEHNDSSVVSHETPKPAASVRFSSGSQFFGDFFLSRNMGRALCGDGPLKN